jgi:colicin import membrane protein
MPELAEAFDAERRSAFRRALLLSCVVHGALLTLFYWSPSFSSSVPAPPGIVTVDLVAAPPGVAPAPAPPAPKPQTPAPAPVEAPKPPPPPPPPPPQKVVLPKEPTQLPQKPPPKPKPKPLPKDYDALMRELREQSGDARPQAVEQTRPSAPVTVASGGGGSVSVSPEVAAWIRDVKIQVHKNWIKSPDFEHLVTTLLVTLDAEGNVVGEPKVKQRSGNPYYDDSVIRAIHKASPLPKPPSPGEWTFVFPSEESS